MKKLLTLLFIGSFIGNGNAIATTTSAPASLPKLHVANNHFIDEEGRTVILHGFNEMNKRPPYEPSTIGFDERNINFIASHGFNVIRLGVYWAAIQPTPGSYDTAYLDDIKRTVTLLAQYHIYTLIDFHQDSYSTLHDGAGEPSWAAFGVGPFTDLGFPVNLFSGFKLMGKTVGPQVDEDYDGFWQNKSGTLGIGVQTLYMKMLNFTASYLKGMPSIIGYELMNEPFIGSQWKVCKTPGTDKFTTGCPDFDKNFLEPFTKNGIQAIKTADPTAIVFYAPIVFFGMGAPTFLDNLHSENLSFSFHNYNSLDKILSVKDQQSMELPFKNMSTQININSAAPILTEFDANRLTPTEFDYILDLADQYQTSWMDWAYTNNPSYTISAIPGQKPEDPATEAIVNDPQKPLTGNNVNWQRLTELTRPYPQYIAGNLVAYSYKKTVSQFSLTYTPQIMRDKKTNSSGITVIYIPSLIYPKGYQVSINGASITSIKNSSQLTIVNNPNSSLVNVIVTPA